MTWHSLREEAGESTPASEREVEIAFETWATFSVADHLADRMFVADVLLTDRLVMRVPDDQERERWQRLGRAPDVLDRKLSILEEPRATEGQPRQRLEWSESYRSYLDHE